MARDNTITPLGNKLSGWPCAKGMADSLVKDGWLSPNTYDNHFAPLIDGPAVYLFQLIETYRHRRAVVAYVGMSTALSRRIASHNILPLLSGIDGYWPKVWFKPEEAKSLRKSEKALIRQFDPPWNIAGRQRGVRLQ